MKFNKAYKFRIYPTKDQEILIKKTMGSCRFIWNNVLDYRKGLYASRQKTYSKYDSIKELTTIKKIDGYEWLKDTDSIALQQSLIDLDTAYQNMFRKFKKDKKATVSFKSKNGKQSYRTINIKGSIRVSFGDKKIKLPKLGFVKFRDNRTFEDKIKSATIIQTITNKFFVSILTEFEFEPNLPMTVDPRRIFSADMSAKNMMVSEEMEFKNQKFYRKSERRLKIRQRRLSKKLRKSNNRGKEKLRIANFHEKIVNKRRGFQKNLAHLIVKGFDVLCFEDLNMEAMKKFNSGLAKTVSLDFSWSEFLNYITWLAFKYNKHLVKIDRWFPSSKMCSECGAIKEDLTLKDRTYKCDCGFVLDRDVNASRNIKKVGLSQLFNKGVSFLKKPTALMAESYACGDMTEVTRSAQESTSFREW